MARTNKNTPDNVLRTLRAIRGLDREAHFKSGGSLTDWRGRHDVRSDKVKEESRRACRNFQFSD